MQSDTPPDEIESDPLRLPGRRDFLALLGLAGTAGLAGCNFGGTQSATATQWVEGSSTDAESLLWIQVADAASAARVGTALDGAYAITTDDEVFPLWLDISTDDQRVYECRLREGLHWSDPYGPMTAEDWVYTIQEVFQAPDNWAGYANQGSWRRNGEFVPVVKTGRRTFEIRLPEPDSAFPLRPILWGSFCLPRGLLEQYVPDRDVEGLKRDREIQTLAYSGNLGPYRFERWDRESQFVATRNPDYYMHDATDVPETWQQAPYFDRFVFEVIPEESTRLSALQTGEVTTSDIPSSKVSQFESLPSVRVLQAPQPYNLLLVYNQRANGWRPFRQQGVRQALSWVVDKRAIADSILRGHAAVAHTFQPQWSDWYDDSAVRQTGVGDRYDPAEARDRLVEALPSGYGYDGSDLVGPDGQQVRLTLVYPIGTQSTKTTVEYIAQTYETVGIDVSLDGVQFNTLLRKYAQNSYRGQGSPPWQAGPFNAGPRDAATSQESWDLMYGIAFNTYPRSPTDTRGFWERRGDTNFFGYHPGTDTESLFDTAATATDDAVRQQALTEVFGVLSREQPCNFLTFETSITGYRDEITGFGPTEFGFGWNSTTWKAGG